MSEEKAAPKPQEVFPGKEAVVSDEPLARPVHQSSVAVRTLLQQISSHENMEEDSAADSGEEDEFEDNNDRNDDEYEKKYSNSNSVESDSRIVEIVAPKKAGKAAAPYACKKPAQAAIVQEDESDLSEDDGNGKSDSPLNSRLPYILSA